MTSDMGSMTRTSTRFTGVVLLAALAGMSVVGAETFRHGNSTTVIEQHGGNGQSQSRVERYRDGQKIITRDGGNTDITIQRQGGGPRHDGGSAHPDEPDDGFLRRFFHWRFSGVAPEHGDGAAQREDFQQRMHERMRRDFRR